MPPVNLSSQAYGRSGLPRARLLNQYLERTPEGPTAFALRPRPGLVAGDVIGFGPVRCITTHQGYRFIVSGTRVFRDGVQVGVIPGTIRMRFAQSDEQLVMVAGGVAYLVGAAVSTIAIPDSDLVSDVAFSGGRFVYSVQDTGKYRFAEIGDAEDIGDLNFATAESDPDPIISMESLGSDLLFLGGKSTEWHGQTSDPAAPFQRYDGRRYDVGSAAQNSAVRIDNGMFWIGTAQSADRTDLKVYRTGAVAEVISTPAIDAFLSRCADISLATAIEVPTEGRSFYVLNIPGVTTVAYDVREKTWAEWSSYGKDTFRIQCADAGLYGDNDTGQMWTFDTETYLDGTDPIIRICSAYIPTMTRQRVSSLCLHAARGEGAVGTSPRVEMRFTDTEDAGWGDWDSCALGPSGVHPAAVWRQQGQIMPPGRQLEFRCSDDVLFVPFGLTVNEYR